MGRVRPSDFAIMLSDGVALLALVFINTVEHNWQIYHAP